MVQGRFLRSRPSCKLRSKAPPPLPEILFDLDGDKSIKTIHHHNENRLPSMVSTPSKKTDNGIVNLMTSDEESTCSSSDDGSRSAAANGGEYSPSSSAEDNSQT